MVDYNKLNLNNIYKSWLQNNIETATAKGLLGGDNPSIIAKEDLLKPIDDIINNAKKMLNSRTRGVMTGEGTITYGGPTSASFNRPGGVKPKLNINTSSIKSSVPLQKNIVPGMKLGKSLGGPVGLGLMLAPALYNMAKDTWRNMNLDTMDPELRELILKGKDLNKNKDNKKNINDIPTSLPEGMVEYNPDNIADIQQIDNKAKQIQIANEIADLIPTNDNELQKENNDIDIIKQYIDKLNENYNSYNNALGEYINNYDKNLNNYHRARDFYTGLAGWSGNEKWADLGRDYNTLQNEANKLSLMKQIQDANISNIDKAYEALGNMAIAQDIGLPSEAAFANKNLLSAYSMKERDAVKQAIANAQIKAKMYGIDERTALMKELQNLKYKMGVDVANIYMGNGLPVGLNVSGQPQLTSVAPVQYPQQQVQSVDPRQQFFN